MYALISPAKKLDFDSEWSASDTTQPDFLVQSQALVDVLKALPAARLQALMKLSDKLGALNYDRYQRYEAPFTRENARPAVYAFRGDTYVGLDADSLPADALSYAQDHLGVLSGLYGVLRPLDLMQAYRLEMGAKLANPRGEDLYDFWGDTLRAACEARVAGHKDPVIISLASNEYIKAVREKDLSCDFITCHFKEVKDGVPKTIGLFAKRARGMMARYIIENRTQKREDLKDFQDGDYRYAQALSDAHNYVFLREAS